MFETVLVANRGEIAVRVIRTLRALGIRSVAVHSDADAGAKHVREADLAVRLGAAPAQESYLSVQRVIDAALRTRAQAIHPGYGFLSENADFADACAQSGLVFIGPAPEAVRIMGDKIRAKQAVAAAGIAVVPGRFEPEMTDADLTAAAAEVGYPVLLKPAAGGGGKGMRQVVEPAALAQALISARREARSSFGDDRLFVERFVARPRHIEVQVLADAHGGVIHLGERECSLQRRHQKVIEEAPSVLLDPPARRRIGTAAVEIARSVGYLGAGTVEFIVSADQPEQFFFLEMNTRLQVEHPVTELVTGLDLVAEQLRIAAGQPLRLTQEQVRIAGHAIEARVYAEDPARDFLPTGGTVLLLREPVSETAVGEAQLVRPSRDDPAPDSAAGDDRKLLATATATATATTATVTATGAPVGPTVIRVDSGIVEGTEIGPWYDPMLSKVIAWAPDRPAALAGLRNALSRNTIFGVTTNLIFLRGLLDDPDVKAGRLDTQLIDRLVAKPPIDADVPESALHAYALARLVALRPPPSAGLWAQPSGWRLGEPCPLTFRVTAQPGGAAVQIRIWGTADAATVLIEPVAGLPGGPAGGPAPIRSQQVSGWFTGAGELLVTSDGLTAKWLHAVDADSLWLSNGEQTWRLSEVARPSARQVKAPAATAEIRSPMPGTVLTVDVAPGDEIALGRQLLVIEAMKMEYAVRAVADGVVRDVLVKVGDRVRMGQLLLTAPSQSADIG